MNKTKNLIGAFAIIVLSTVCFTANAQQLKVPVPSPSATIKQSVGLAEVTVAHGRKCFYQNNFWRRCEVRWQPRARRNLCVLYYSR